MRQFTLRPLAPADANWIPALMAEWWGSPIVVVHHATYVPHELPGFVALDNETPIGILTYHLDGAACEIVTLNSLREGQGIGSALIEAAAEVARQAGCSRLWLITTNDNLHALRFYQKRGFALAALYPNAVTRSRQIKPEIPLVGNDGIPLRDELELEMALTPAPLTP